MLRKMKHNSNRKLYLNSLELITFESATQGQLRASNVSRSVIKIERALVKPPGVAVKHAYRGAPAGAH